VLKVAKEHDVPWHAIDTRFKGSTRICVCNVYIRVKLQSSSRRDTAFIVLPNTPKPCKFSLPFSLRLTFSMFISLPQACHMSRVKHPHFPS
jgi:hypothetical protein